MAAKLILEGIEVKVGGDRSIFLRELWQQIQDRIREVVAQCIGGALEQEVEALLGRDFYERSKPGRKTFGKPYCLKCKTHRREHFRRNGHKERQLVVGGVGPVVVWMPRLECKLCQGTVHMEYQTIKSRQRLWDNLGEEVRALYGLGLSLREIKVQEEGHGQAGLGLRSLNRFVHKMGEVAASWQEREWSSSPPVMLLDAIWVKVMKPTGQRQVDKLGRQRPVKEGGRVPVLVALGVWPQEGKKVILDWETGQGSGEDAESWVRLLTRLEGHGVNGRNGLRLIVHDGGSGLCVALDEVHFAARQQRCVFHKLRNILDSVLVPEEYNRKEAGRLKKKILKEASAIWQAEQKETAQRRQAKFVERWQKEQPKVTAAIQRDFEDTIAFYDVTKEAKQNGQKWSPTWLRTTSLLERANRTYRRKLRSAVIIHSLVGLGAILTQLAARIDFPGSWPSLINRLVAQVT